MLILKRFDIMKKPTLLLILFLSLNHCNKDTPTAPTPNTLPTAFTPAAANTEIIQHTHYTLSYIEHHEQAEWVYYRLTKDRRMTEPRVERTDNFRPDPNVSTGSAQLEDYKGSGYDRGHLCPAADMAHSELAMSETFFMSNMSPQSPSFNRGIWRSLESDVRDWAVASDTLHIVTGPILQNKQYPTIGPNNVTIPDYYYKALLDIAGPDHKAIAFILPNTKGEHDILDYAVTIDSLETLTNIDLFHELPNDLETQLEKTIDVQKWH